MGGGSETTAKSEYPPEFRPLAESAVGALRAFQQMNPLALYATPNPAGTAWESPWQAASLRALPAIAETPRPLYEAGRLPDAMAPIMEMVLSAGDVSPTAQSSIGRLGGAPMSSGSMRRGSRAAEEFEAARPRGASQETVLGRGDTRFENPFGGPLGETNPAQLLQFFMGSLGPGLGSGASPQFNTPPQPDPMSSPQAQAALLLAQALGAGQQAPPLYGPGVPGYIDPGFIESGGGP